MKKVVAILIVLSTVIVAGCIRSGSNGPNPLNALLDSVTMHDGLLEKGVFRGGLFSHTIEPLTFNRESTLIAGYEKNAVGRIGQFQYPMSQAISIRLGKNGLGQVAKEHGINTIYYADIERWTAVFGFWSMDIVHIYGR